MEIIWNKNPLATVVKLDEKDKEILTLKLKIESHEERLYSAWYHLTEEEHFDMERVKRKLDPENWMEEDDQENKHHYQKMFNYCIEALNDVHGGDCTCVPCSCMKCHAEDLLDIQTMKGLGKRSAYKIDGIFRDNPDISLEEAIAKLENYNPIKGKGWEQQSQEEFDRYVPRWKAEALHAAKWLREYRDAHFPSTVIINDDQNFTPF